MVRPNRIKTYKFNVGSLIADATEFLDVYSAYPVNGMLLGVHVGESTWDGSTGSLFLNVSGPELTMWSMVSGTLRNTGVATSGVTYPRVTAVHTDGTTISGVYGYDEHVEIPMNSVLHLVGSSLGAGTSGLELNIIYI